MVTTLVLRANMTTMAMMTGVAVVCSPPEVTVLSVLAAVYSLQA
jgi:acyl-CoA reductase-like NAD-dependent aldehyde dehydrogenase